MRGPLKKIYVVRYKKDGKMKQKEFAEKDAGQKFLEKLKRNKISDYTFFQSSRMTMFQQLAASKVTWLGREIFLVSLAIGMTVLLGALVLLFAALGTRSFS